ncbi:MAG: serine hydrolase domain-containing protein, partial [Verrucomicrobiales bacterium]
MNRTLTCLASLLGCLPLPAKDLSVTKPELADMSADKLAEVDAATQKLVDDKKIAGAVTLVARKGKIVQFNTYGQSDPTSGRPMKRDTIFRIFSMTKAVTTTAAMQLFEQGKFKLDDPLSKFIPEFGDAKLQNGEKPKREISIRDLMRHTSGLSYGFLGAADYVAAGIGDRDRTLAEDVTAIAKLPLVCEPGTKFVYSVSTDVLGRVVEVISGQTLDQYFREHIFDPLGMPDTGFFVPAEKADRFSAVNSFGENGQLQVIDAPATSDYLEMPKNLSGGGGLISTTSDYFRFCQMVLNRGELDGTRILKPETIAAMTRNQIPDEAMPIGIGDTRLGVGFGLGFS